MKGEEPMSDKSNITLPRPTVALIGLGTMGAGIAERLLDQGFAVDVWNRTPGPAARLTERGATAHAMTEQAAARANVVLTMLPTGDAVKEVMLERNALNAMHSGAVWAQMGTIGVESTDTLRSEVARARPDVAFIDAPVSGSREPGPKWPAGHSCFRPSRRAVVRRAGVRGSWTPGVAGRSRSGQPNEAGAQHLACVRDRSNRRGGRARGPVGSHPHGAA